jgi:upstream activation factor subunit UAF30
MARTKNAKTTTAKATEKKVDATPAPEPVQEAAVNEVIDTPSTDASLAADSQAFLGKLQAACASLTALKTEFRSLEKRWTREMKTAQKAGAKKRRAKGNRSPSGFVKPTLISEELAAFLGKDKGTEMARTEVTREINKYIRSHDLQDKNNGRKINPDAKLAKLLKLKKTDELTYFNLQRYMSPHFAKAGASKAAVELESSN